MRRRTRCSVTTAPGNGSHMLEKLSLQQALEGAQRQFGAHSKGGRLFQVARPNTAKLRWPVELWAREGIQSLENVIDAFPRLK